MSNEPWGTPRDASQQPASSRRVPSGNLPRYVTCAAASRQRGGSACSCSDSSPTWWFAKHESPRDFVWEEKQPDRIWHAHLLGKQLLAPCVCFRLSATDVVLRLFPARLFDACAASSKTLNPRPSTLQALTTHLRLPAFPLRGQLPNQRLGAAQGLSGLVQPRLQAQLLALARLELCRERSDLFFMF